MKCLQMYVL
uniref:Uncharacterized protein n=1 Tax=Rhizophora mucronata TaxID=61149 RepID=A0A2P2NQG0_RHIMU